MNCRSFGDSTSSRLEDKLQIEDDSFVLQTELVEKSNSSQF